MSPRIWNRFLWINVQSNVVIDIHLNFVEVASPMPKFICAGDSQQVITNWPLLAASLNIQVSVGNSRSVDLKKSSNHLLSIRVLWLLEQLTRKYHCDQPLSTKFEVYPFTTFPPSSQPCILLSTNKYNYILQHEYLGSVCAPTAQHLMYCITSMVFMCK